MTLDVDHLLATLTLEEKASLLSGESFWYTQEIRRGDEVLVPSVMVTDGPHGLRKQEQKADHLGLARSVPATCFPTAVTLASTWDPELLERVGVALGVETAANEVAVLLGPGVNIKRSPLCGRNFEYFSEDPYLTGSLAAPLTKGVQSEGVGTSLKHFAANNQESDRMRSDSQVDERTLREIYLPGFEQVIKATQPWTVMCSYNRVNGTYASEHPWLLNTLLRDEWGFEGLVVSDWGAVRDRVAGVAAGLDLQMPPDGGRGDRLVVEAVESGRLSAADLDTCVRRVLELVAKSPARDGVRPFNVAGHHSLAREAAAAGTVLLKNEGALLPLTSLADVVVIGELARTPRYQGAGSSQVIPTRLDSALDAFGALAADLPFAAGYLLDGQDGGSGTDAAALLAEAVAAARAAETVVLFLGLPKSYESEGFDRTHLHLPAEQVAVLEAVAAVNPRVVVVLANGSAVTTAPWRHHTPAIVEGWLGGQGGGSGVVDVLTGAVNPAGRLAETIPLRLEDNPSYGNFPGEYSEVRYGEGVLVGYRWYDYKRLEVDYPFGHGLSYTDFEYGPVTAQVSGEGAGTSVEVAFTVKNVGSVAGAEVPQVYVADLESSVLRPLRELKGFTKVYLEPGASTQVTIGLDARALAFWHPILRRWAVEGGDFEISVGASSRDLRGATTVTVVGEDLSLPITSLTSVKEALAHQVLGPKLAAMLKGRVSPGMAAMIDDMPLESIADFGLFPGINRNNLDETLKELAA